MQVVDRTLDRIDGFQRRHRALAFPFAVIKKFGDDQAGNLAALVAYYGFFSIFPLLLVLMTILGFVLRGNLSAQDAVLRSALSSFPVIGEQIHSEGVRSISASGVALAIGIVGTLWGGLGGIKTFESAMNTVWNVPRKRRPNVVKTSLRALIMLAVLGSGTLIAAALSAIGGGADTAWWPVKILGLTLALLVNLGVFLVAFKVLTVADVTWGQVLPGALTAAIAWVTLQSVGGYYVSHQLKNASSTYGTFATVIGLLTYLYLGAQITLIAAEVNVVRARALWPRSMRALNAKDQEVFRAKAKEEERHPSEHVTVEFDAPATPPSEASATG